MGELLKVQLEGKIATFTLNRPPYNPLNLELVREISKAVTAIENNPDIHAVVICGEGEKAFCAGADINGFVPILGSKDRSLISEFHQTYNHLARLPIPVISALKGHVLGGGLELALACDFRICEEETKLGLPEVNLGLLPGAGGTQRLPRIVGQSKALEMILFGKPIAANEALSLGLVNLVVAKGSAEAVAREWAEALTEKSKPVLAQIKRVIQEGLNVSLLEGLEKEQEAFSSLFLLEDSKEGISAFLEKRKASFTHR